MARYIVRQGDHLSGIAVRFGIPVDELWNHADNAELRERRPERHTLAAGDMLQIPDRPPPEPLRIAPHSTNRFKAKVPRVPIDVMVRRGADAAASEPFEVHGDGAVIHGTTESDGKAHFEIGVLTREVRFKAPSVPIDTLLRVGGLDPIEEESGVVQRLEGLGFSPHPLHSEVDAPGTSNVIAEDAPDAHHIPLELQRDPRRRAIALFQRSRSLEVTGAMNDETRSALRSAYGS